MLNSPTAILIDSDCGWENTGEPRAKVFGLPSFSITSSNGILHYQSQISEKKYKGNPIEEIEKYLHEGYTCVGYIAYEYSKFTNKKIKIKSGKEGFNSYDTCFHFYKENQIESYIYEELAARLGLEKEPEPNKDSLHLSNFTKNEYLEIIRKARDYISAGDIYQVNLSQKFTTSSLKDSYRTLLKFYDAQPVPFSALLKFRDHTVISGSMELFLRKTGNTVYSKPIKGTAKRSNDKNTDNKIKAQLRESDKEKAENLMIVDLMRNDLSRICETGSVKVNELFRINKYKTLYQMESEVEGLLENDITLREILSGTFPPGSVTGAPKSRALDIIEELEPHYRGPYCGAYGVFYPNKDFTLSVAIRIMLSLESNTCYWVGGGIVWDSEPEKEYEETLLKAKAIRKTLT